MSDRTEVQDELRDLREENINLREENINLMEENNNLKEELKSSRAIMGELLKTSKHDDCQARYVELLQQYNLLLARDEKLNKRVCDRDCCMCSALDLQEVGSG